MRIQISGLLVLVFALAGSVAAQNATGSIQGIIRDEQGKVIPNASVAVANLATGSTRKIGSSAAGAYAVENLVPGEYEVKVEAQGFSTKIATATVQVGGTTTANFSLTVGSTTQSVTITTEAPLVNTTETTVGGVISRERVESLPINGRSFLSTALLEPGVRVSYAANSGAGNPNNYFQVSVGGAPQQMTVISIDGARVNDRITGGTSQNFSAETVQEFQISTLGFDLSAGTVSAGVVNVVSRTGTNAFHGSSFFFFRDHNMASFPGFKRPTDPTALSPICLNPSSAACGRLQDPFFVRRQYGGTFGGPIKKDKLFFFGNYERNDQVGAQPITFTDTTLFGFNHVAQQPQKGHLANVRMDYTINDKHTAFMRGGIDSNNGVAGTGMETTWISSNNFAYQTQMGLTSVFKPTLVNDFRFSYSYFRNRLAPPSQEECLRIGGNPAYCFNLGGPRITYYGGLVTGTNVNVSQDRHPRTFQWTDNVNWTIGSHRVRFGGNWEHSNSRGSWNQNSPGSFTAFSPTTTQLVPALYNALPASLKPGGTGATFADLMRLPMAGTLSIGIGDPGQPAPFNRDKNLANDHYRFYIQDAWQIRPGLTVNYGLGWSYENNVLYHDLDLPEYLRPVIGSKLGKIPYNYGNFDPALGFVWALGKSRKTVIRASASLHHISPNVGFFNLNQRIYFGPSGNGLQPVTGAVLTNPKTGSGFLNFGTPTDFSLQDMLTYVPTAKGLLARTIAGNGTDLSIRGVNIYKTVAGSQLLDAVYNEESARAPYTFQVNAGVQREIVRNLSVSADLVMRRGVGFGAFELFFPDYNRYFRVASYTLPATGTVADANRVYNPIIPRCTGTQGVDPRANCSLGAIQYGLAGILSRYTALQVKVDKRFSRGFQITGAYSLAQYTTFSALASNDNLHEGHGISTGLPRQSFTGSAIWDLPKYKGQHGLLRGALNGWQLSSLMQMSTGAPTTTNIGGNINSLGPASGGFDVDGDGNYTFRLPGAQIGGFGRYLSANDIRKLVEQYNAKYPAPKDTIVQQIGVANRDKAGTPYPVLVLPDRFAPGDSFLSHDLRVTREIRITEKLKLQLIAEGFNIFNIANLTGFSGTLDKYVRPTGTVAANGTVSITVPGRNPAFNFGQATGRFSPVFGSGGPRAFQFAARLSF